MGFLRTSTTRIAGALSLLALAAVTVSDFLLTDFWDRNAMATSVVADVFVLMVGVAVVNEFLAARSRRRWQLVADYGVLELSRTSRRVWVQLAEAIGAGTRDELTREELRELVLSQEDGERASSLAEGAAASSELRRNLHGVTSRLAPEARGALTAWAPVLLETPEASALSRFVEIQAVLSALDLVLREEVEGWRPTSPGTGNPAWIGSRIVSLIQLGSDLEEELRTSAHRLSHPLGLGEGT